MIIDHLKAYGTVGYEHSGAMRSRFRLKNESIENIFLSVDGHLIVLLMARSLGAAGEGGDNLSPRKRGAGPFSSPPAHEFFPDGAQRRAGIYGAAGVLVLGNRRSRIALSRFRENTTCDILSR